MSMTIILLAVLLLAAIALVIAYGIRSTRDNSSEESDRLLATTIINQGTTLQRGFQQVKFDAGNIENCYITLSNTNSGPYYGLYNPANADWMPMQYPPAAALNDASQQWAESWTLCWGYINEPGVGHPDNTYGDFGITLADLKQGVCQQINRALYNTTSIPVSTEDFNTWVNNPSQLILHPGNSDQPQACIQTSDGKYIYYQIVDTRLPGDPDGSGG